MPLEVWLLLATALVIMVLVGLLVRERMGVSGLLDERSRQERERADDRLETVLAGWQKEHDEHLEEVRATWQKEHDDRVETLRADWQKERDVENKEWRARLKDERVDAARKSRVVSFGRIVETLVPFLQWGEGKNKGKFPFEPSDCRFIGSPIDFLVFDGLLYDDVKKVVFVEVKTGKSRLTVRERSVRKAVEENRVQWKTVTLDGLGEMDSDVLKNAADSATRN